MKFALCNELFESWNTDRGFDFPRVLEYVARCGYDGIEVAPFTIDGDAFRISSSRRTEIRRQVDRAGLTLTGLHWLLARTEGYYLTSPDAVVRQRTAEYFIELVRLCADLGGKYLVLGSPLQRNLLPGTTFDHAMDYAAGTLVQILPTLEQCDVRIAVEPLARSETDFLNTAAEAVQLIRRIGTPERIALHLDCKAMSDEAISIPELIRQNRENLIYFHANDPNLQGPGFGQLAFGPVLQALEEIGYDGWVSVEPFDYSPGVETLAEKSLACLKEALVH